MKRGSSTPEARRNPRGGRRLTLSELISAASNGITLTRIRPTVERCSRPRCPPRSRTCWPQRIVLIHRPSIDHYCGCLPDTAHQHGRGLRLRRWWAERGRREMREQRQRRRARGRSGRGRAAHRTGARDPPAGRRRMHIYKEKVRSRRPGGAGGAQAAMAGWRAPASGARSWPPHSGKKPQNSLSLSLSLSLSRTVPTCRPPQSRKVIYDSFLPVPLSAGAHGYQIQTTNDHDADTSNRKTEDAIKTEDAPVRPGSPLPFVSRCAPCNRHRQKTPRDTECQPPLEALLRRGFNVIVLLQVCKTERFRAETQFILGMRAAGAAAGAERSKPMRAGPCGGRGRRL